MNSNSATGVGVGFGGKGGSVENSGNSSNTNANVNVADSESVSNADSFSSSLAINEQGQGQAQGQGQSVNMKFEATDAVAASAPNLVLGTCQAGLTGQSQMGGGSMGGPDEVCLLFTLSQIQMAMGDMEGAQESVDLAADTLKWRANVVRRAFQAVPLIGRIF